METLYLVHHGTKGMKWGVHKSRSAIYEDGGKPSWRKTRKEAYSQINKERNKAINDAYSSFSKDAKSGKYSSREAERRTENAAEYHRTKASAQKNRAKADFYKERAGMQKKEKRAEKDLKKAERLEKRAADKEAYAKEVNKMAKETNKTYDTKLKSGEKIATDYLMSTDAKNAYLQQRKNMSGKEAMGRAAVETALDYAKRRNL